MSIAAMTFIRSGHAGPARSPTGAGRCRSIRRGSWPISSWPTTRIASAERRRGLPVVALAPADDALVGGDLDEQPVAAADAAVAGDRLDAR